MCPTLILFCLSLLMYFSSCFSVGIFLDVVRLDFDIDLYVRTFVLFISLFCNSVHFIFIFSIFPPFASHHFSIRPYFHISLSLLLHFYLFPILYSAFYLLFSLYPFFSRQFAILGNSFLLFFSHSLPYCHISSEDAVHFLYF